MKKLLLTFMLTLGLVSISQAKVAFLVPADNTDLVSMQYEEYQMEVDGENRSFEQSPERRAWIWFNDEFVAAGEGQFICFNDLANIPSDIHAIWIYVDRVGFNAEAFDALFAGHISELQAFVNNGGNIFLAKQATRLEPSLVGATQADGTLIQPDYTCNDYVGAMTWAVDFAFYEGDEWGSYINHPIYKYAPHKNPNEAELIWTNGGKLTDNNCGIPLPQLGMEDRMDSLNLAAFESRNHCKVLGSWANGNAGCEYGGVIEFYPNGTRQGTVLMMGLAAYQWINNNAGNGWNNTRVITRSALHYLENLHPNADPYEIGYILPSSLASLQGWYDGEQPEYNAAVWFRDNYINAEKKGRFIPIEELPDLYAKGLKTVWVNVERIGISTADGMFNDTYTNNIRAFVQAGGNVLLTKQATRFAFLMGRIGYAPEFNSSPTYLTEDQGPRRSIATRMGVADGVDEILDMSSHPLYNDMLAWTDAKNVYLVGTDCKKTYDYCSWQDFFRATDEDTHYDNRLIQRLRDFENDWSATVIGIRGDVGDYCLSNVIEFNAKDGWAGRILTIGSDAYQWGTSNNGVERENLSKLTTNALSYLMGEETPTYTYERNITAGEWGTICLNYAVAADHIEGAEIYELVCFDEDYEHVIVKKVQSMEAGHPYFYLGTAQTLRLEYAGQSAEAMSIRGLVGYIGESALEVSAGNYVLADNQLNIVDTNSIVTIESHEAYIHADNIPAYQSDIEDATRFIAIFMPEKPSAIENVRMQDTDESVYDILGRRMVDLSAPGMYIINGHKRMTVQ